jgi:hypothetical protein
VTPGWGPGGGRAPLGSKRNGISTRIGLVVDRGERERAVVPPDVFAELDGVREVLRVHAQLVGRIANGREHHLA